MFPSQQPPDNGGDDLEARLRGLILSNANTQVSTESANDVETKSQPPPHILSATSAEQQDYLANISPPHRPDPDNRNVQRGRKRPNQAQRRQMSSQISVDVDTSPSRITQGPGFAATTRFGPPQWNRALYNGSPQTQHNQRYFRHQNHSPHFQNTGPPTSLSSQPVFSQNSPRSPGHHQYQPGLDPGHVSQQGPSPYTPGQSSYAPRPSTQGRQLYQPGPYQSQWRGAAPNWGAEEITAQISHLETCLQTIIPTVHVDHQELSTKEMFRLVVEKICREAIANYEIKELQNLEFDPSTVELQCFGSMMSGFATKGSDMDLALLSPMSKPAPDSPDSLIPRLLEKCLLDMSFGARLLTRTRVPIIKLCQKPPEKLRADLLLERAKWDNGFAGYPREEEEINEARADSKAVLDEEAVGSEAIPTQVRENFKSTVESYEKKLASLKQKDQHSLGEYHNAAKRLLKNLGGRDVISVNSNELDEEGLQILNDVCKAFISGLSSRPLISRLKSYPSISPLFNPSLPAIQRTLQGIAHQVEGERLAMALDYRPLTEQNDKRENECLMAVEAWRTLQNVEGLATVAESLRYNKVLHIALERMKRNSSLQLVYFQQMPQEEPTYYYGRAQKLLGDLQGYDRSQDSSTNPVSPIIVAQYIAGISSSEIREALQKSSRTSTTLQCVSLQHRALQLAVDYEHALKTRVYDEEDRPHVENYIAYLRELDLTNPARNPEQDLPAGNEAKLVAKIRSLPEPGDTKFRDRYKDHLEFPKSDIGVQCDINFAAQLAIQNTLLLRCYSHCDSRVKPMILFIKHWAKVRGINTPYRGSLSSYGYVLMVLHYLVNVAQPFVCPNLQSINKDPPPYLSPAEIEARSTCNGYDVRFWRNETEIKSLAERKMLNHNHDSLGLLLRGFFEYFAMKGSMTTVPHKCFDWGREVLSLRTQGGILLKQEKGWVGAKTTIETKTVAAPLASAPKAPEADSSSPRAETHRQTEGGPEAKTPKPTHAKTVEETKEVRHRFLFAIEDPFELEHNVARTVTHSGIVSIRDEFRRAWRIIRSVGKPDQPDSGLLDPINMAGGVTKSSWEELLYLIHGPPPKTEIAVGYGGPEKQ